KLPGLPVEHRVGEALEGLAEHDVLAGRRVEGSEVQVREIAAAAAVSPLGGQHDEVEGVRALDLQPARAAVARLVGRIERLGHEALVAGRERALVENARRGLGGGDRKSTRLNSSHLGISYAVFCLKKKKIIDNL